MISVNEAQEFIRRNTPPAVATTKPLADSLGHYLAEDILAERDYPPFDRITHDGIAIAAASLTPAGNSFRIQSYAAAGSPREILRENRSCIEVATGAALPEGCDTVIPYELLEMKDGVATVTRANVKAGNCLHPQGSDRHKGEKLLERHQKIQIHEMAILASNGVANVPVYTKPSLAVLATGNELVATHEMPKLYQIRRSNDVALRASLTLAGFSNIETAAVADDKDVIRGILQLWLNTKKVILITGGVSRGTYDYVPEVLKNLSVKEIFHRVAQKPGKPLWFGVAAEGGLAFGLPGNPASSVTCLTRYVIPTLIRMAGGKAAPLSRLRLSHPAKSDSQLTRFAPVKIDRDTLQATPSPTQGSGDFIGLQGTDGFVELPPAKADYFAKDSVSFFPWVSL